jgi:hypothetical protein
MEALLLSAPLQHLVETEEVMVELTVMVVIQGLAI